METIATTLAEIEGVEEGELITGEALLERGDLGRCELVKGVVVGMSPTGLNHSIIEANAAACLRHFVRKHKLGFVGTGEGGIYTGRNPDTVRAADVFFLSHERRGQQRGRGFMRVAPELVVEVLSPSTSGTDRREKLQAYRQADGLREYLIIDQQQPSVERHWTNDGVTWWNALYSSDAVPIECLTHRLPVSAIYRDIQFT